MPSSFSMAMHLSELSMIGSPSRSCAAQSTKKSVFMPPAMSRRSTGSSAVR